jgi:2-phospho-L-lactate guanylyltransferase (CobY/MobA/RfbA family)
VYDELTAPKKRKLADILQGEEREAEHVQEALLAQVLQAARHAEAEVCSPYFPRPVPAYFINRKK